MQKKISLRHMYFNRFVTIRYSTAFFLFLNLYWAVFLLGALSIASIIPSLLFIFGLLTMLEQVNIYRHHTNKLPYAEFFYKTIFISFITALIAIYSPLYDLFYPFLKYTQNTITMLTILIIFNIFIASLMIRKLNQIKSNQDKYFKRIRSYECLIN